METSLHRTLKSHYAADDSQIEVRVGAFRVDAIDDCGRLVEVQHAGLGAIRGKVAKLLEEHSVRVVKPIVANKWIHTLDKNSLKVARKRRSPKRSCHLDVFASLLHFTQVFPHPRMTLEVPLLDIIETRVPEKKRRVRAKQYRVLDQTIVSIHDELVFQGIDDLWRMVSMQPTFDPKISIKQSTAKRTKRKRESPIVFDTAVLAQWLDRPRWFAQQVAYVLDRCGVTSEVGKLGNAKLYQLDDRLCNFHGYSGGAAA
jgi:hypothetical protein